MKVTVMKEDEMPLLARKELVLNIESDGKTPSRVEVKEAIAKKFNVDKKLVAIKEIKQGFGSTTVQADVRIYEKEEDLLKLEKRTKREQEAEKPKEEPKAEAPAEEAKEEVKEEPKPEEPKEEVKEEPKGEE